MEHHGTDRRNADSFEFDVRCLHCLFEHVPAEVRRVVLPTVDVLITKSAGAVCSASARHSASSSRTAGGEVNLVDALRGLRVDDVQRAGPEVDVLPFERERLADPEA